MGLRMKNFSIVSSLKNPIFRGVHEKPIYRGNCLKREAWTVYEFKRGFGEKEENGVFEETLIHCAILLQRCQMKQ